jgi:hypothetical protein
LNMWGWASWRRAWKHYDFTMRDWPILAKGPWLQELFLDRSEIDYWRKIFWGTYSGRIDTWDYQWAFACWRRGGLSLVPPKNLITNIGGQEYATHPQVLNMDLPAWSLSKKAFDPIPVQRNRAWDKECGLRYFSGIKPPIWQRAVRRLSRAAAKSKFLDKITTALGNRSEFLLLVGKLGKTAYKKRPWDESGL